MQRSCGLQHKNMRNEADERRRARSRRMLSHDAHTRQANRTADTKKATPLGRDAHARQANTARLTSSGKISSSQKRHERTNFALEQNTSGAFLKFNLFEKTKAAERRRCSDEQA